MKILMIVLFIVTMTYSQNRFYIELTPSYNLGNVETKYVGFNPFDRIQTSGVGLQGGINIPAGKGSIKLSLIYNNVSYETEDGYNNITSLYIASVRFRIYIGDE